MLGLLHERNDAGNFLVERASCDQAKKGGGLHLEVRLAFRLIGDAEECQRRWRWLRLPHCFKSCELHFLVVCERVAALVAEYDDGQGREKAEGGSDNH